MPRSSLLLLCLAAFAIACTSPPPPATPPLALDEAVVIDDGVYLRAEVERVRLLEREITRLRADLGEAEAAIVSVESGLMGQKTRADAVSATAGARVELERVRSGAPWSQARLAEADAKLEEAERQLEAGYFGAAIFFASRAERLSRQILEEARAVGDEPDRCFIVAERVNLRAGPSRSDEVLGVLVRDTPLILERSRDDWSLVRTPRGRVGWVYSALIR